MSDNLTKKLQKQLEARGTIASTTQINRALETLSEENENSLDSGSLFNPSVTAEEEPQSPPQQQNRFEDFLSVAEQAGITEKQDSSSVLNAVGAGLWTFADTAASNTVLAFVLNSSERSSPPTRASMSSDMS